MAGPGLQVRVEGEAVWRKFQQAQPRMSAAINRSLRLAVAWVTRDAKLGAPVRSGRLRASIRGRVEQHFGSQVGIVGSNVVYARIQELGGPIRAKHAKYLTIPLDAARTPSGVARAPARSWPNTFVIQGRGGHLIIMQRHGRGIRPLFVLKRSVRLEPNPYFRPALEKNRASIREQFGRDVKLALEAP
jgi:phage gpG-like protein